MAVREGWEERSSRHRVSRKFGRALKSQAQPTRAHLTDCDQQNDAHEKSRDVARDLIYPIENRPEGLEDATDDFGLNRRKKRDRQGESENPYPQWNSNKIRPVSHGSSYQVCAPDRWGTD